MISTLSAGLLAQTDDEDIIDGSGEGSGEVSTAFEATTTSTPYNNNDNKLEETTISSAADEGWMNIKIIIIIGAIGLITFTSIIFLCIHRMKKRDHGSYNTPGYHPGAEKKEYLA